MKKTLLGLLVFLCSILLVLAVQHGARTRQQARLAAPAPVVRPGAADAHWRTPVFSPGPGPSVLACTALDRPGVFLRYPDGSEVTAYGGKLAEPFLCWSPDGRYISARAEKQPEMTPRAFALIVIDVHNRTMAQVTDFLPGLGRPAWRLSGNGRMEVYAPIPDGLVRFPYATQLAGAGSGFFLYEQNGEVWLHPDTGTPHQLSRGGGYAPQLSPTGSAVLYQWGNTITVADLDEPPFTGGTRLRLDGVSPCWSPDGSRIAFIRETDTGSEESRRSDAWMVAFAPFSGEANATPLTGTPQEPKADLTWPEPNRLYYAVLTDGSIRSIDVPREE